MEKKTQTIMFGTAMFFICCYFMRFFNFPNMLTLVIGGALCLLLFLQQKKLRVDVGICLLTLTMVSHYVICNGVEGLFYSILYIPLMIYVLGNYLTSSLKNSADYEKKFFLLILAMVVGYTILGVLNSYMYFAGYVVPGTRRWQDFWSNDIVPGTQHTAYFLPTLAMFFPAVMYFKKRKVLSVIFIALTIFFCYTALVTKSRMQLVIFVMVCFVQLLLFVLLERKMTRKLLDDKRIRILLLAGFILIAVALFLVKDTSVVRAFIENLGDDGGIIKNARFAGQRLALMQLFDYPMGGRHMDFGELNRYCHNTWLDMANASGLIPFFAFAAYTVYTGCEMVGLLVKRNVSSEIKIVLVGLYISFFLYMTVEPAIEASIHLLTPWIWVNGLIHGNRSCADDR